MKTLEEIKSAALQLSGAEKLELAESLMIGNVDPEIEKAWAAEAQRRWEDYKAGKTSPVSGDEVISRAREKVYAYQNRLTGRAGAGGSR